MMGTNAMRNFAASTAVALAFSSPAHAEEGYKHPLIHSTASASAYMFRLSDTIAPLSGKAAAEWAKANGAKPADVKAAREQAEGDARLRTRGFAKAFEDVLDNPDRGVAKIVDYPPRANAELLRITAVTPAPGLESESIPVCAEQYNKVLGVWNISPKGNITAAAWDGARVSESALNAACKAFVLAARCELTAKYMKSTNQAVTSTCPPPSTATAPQPPPVTPTPIAANPSGNPKL